MPTNEATATGATVLMRFLTTGGAVVELRSHQFSSHYTRQGRPNWSPDTRTVDGYQWTCLGCDQRGEPGYLDNDYLDNERRKARNEANAHASTCRAMPRP